MWPPHALLAGQDGQNIAVARRSEPAADDDEGVSEQPGVRPDPALALLEIYDAALPEVYGYLLSRCRDATLAQDLTAEAFLAPSPRLAALPGR